MCSCEGPRRLVAAYDFIKADDAVARLYLTHALTLLFRVRRPCFREILGRLTRIEVTDRETASCRDTRRYATLSRGGACLHFAQRGSQTLWLLYISALSSSSNLGIVLRHNGFNVACLRIFRRAVILSKFRCDKDVKTQTAVPVAAQPNAYVQKRVCHASSSS